MGGKKGPEKNRKYEKDRRDRFNEQFVELHKLLPDFSSSATKATKAEIISKTIQYLKDSHSQTRKLEIEFENEKIKVSELQKKVNGVLQIVKELIKLLHKSNIRFPSSLPVDDFKTFEDVFAKSKKDLTLVSTDQNSTNDADLEYVESSSDSESEEKGNSSNVPPKITKHTDQSTKQINRSTESVSTVNNLCLSSTVQASSSTVGNSNEPKVLKLNSDAFILPNGNLFTVNGTQNILNCYNNVPPLLLNKPFAMPTLILMQNNFVPVNTVQHIAVSQRTQKLILPKQTINTTKTTFINKKPIPSVRLYKAATIANNGRKAMIPHRRRSRRSKGILVKYPKRKPPTRNKKRELRSKKSSKLPKVVDKSENTDKANTYTLSGEPSFSETSNDDKSYPCADNMLNIAEMPTTGQLIDFLENTASGMDNTAANNSSECNQNEPLKGEKSLTSFASNTFEHFSTGSLGCALIESHKESNPKEIEEVSQKTLTYEQTPSTSDTLLKYVPCEKNFTPNDSVASENTALEKLKSKEMASLRSSKDLNLSLMDDKKHYESSFDEFSNDLFTSLQVPPSGHNADSISPTAAFLQTFPLVSSGANVDLLHEHDDSVTTTTSTTILQIGNLESPPNMLFSSKPANREAPKVGNSADLSSNFVYSTGVDVESGRKEKKNAGKEMTQPSLGFGDASFNNQLKASCSKDAQTYPTSTSTFSAYFTKYNDFPPVTCSYYSFCSQPFTTKTTDSGDFTSWMYTPEESSKEKTKRDKCANSFKSIQEVEAYSNDASAERPKKKPKLSNVRPLVNWMTTPDLRNASDVCQDTYTLSKEDTSLNSYVGCNSNNTNFNAYSAPDYYLENQNYAESQLASCKLSYSSANPCSQTWVPSKTSLPLARETSNVIIPSTLPTLVGDLALGNSSTFNNYDSTAAKKFEPDKKKACRNYCKNITPNSSSFLSVTQLVDDKSLNKTKKHSLDAPMCSFGGEQEKCTYSANHRNDGVEYSSKKNYTNVCKDTKQQPMKCKKDSIKYQVPRCASKENKKDTRTYPVQNCQVQNKEVNPLSSKNSNYSAESLISSSNQNVCSGTGYFPYENSTNYGNCSTNDYAKRRTDEESLANVGYYGNSNYVYPNNFQSFNNYGFSNQCYNNYSSQLQTGGFQKKKDEGYSAKTDTAEWSLSSYNPIVQSDFSNNQKLDPKCKQSFANKFNPAQKNSINSEMYSKYYQGNSVPSTLTQTKSNCAFNSACSFNQTEGQFGIETNYLTPNYEIKSSRHSNGMNTNTVHSATTLTNFNLSTIFPEINDKHCSTSQVNAVSNEKNDPKYSKNNVGSDTNFSYFLQPAAENNADHFFSSSSTFQIHNFTDFTNRKSLT